MPFQYHIDPNLGPQLILAGGEGLARGINQAGAAFAHTLAQRRGERMEADQLRTLLGGPGSANETQPGRLDLSTLGQPESSSSGTGEGGQFSDEQIEFFKKAAKTTKAYESLLENEGGLDPNFLKTQSLPQLRGLAIQQVQRRQAQLDAANLAHLAAQTRQLDTLRGLEAQRSSDLDLAAINQGRQPAMLRLADAYMTGGLVPPPAGQEGPAELVPAMLAGHALTRAAGQTGYQFDPAHLQFLAREGGAGGRTGFFAGMKPGELRPLTTPDGRPIPGAFTTALGENQGQVVYDPTTPQRPASASPPKVIVGQNPLTGEPQVTWSGSPEDFEKAFPHLERPGTPPNTTQAEHARLKKGDKFWWNGKQYTKE